MQTEKVTLHLQRDDKYQAQITFDDHKAGPSCDIALDLFLFSLKAHLTVFTCVSVRDSPGCSGGCGYSRRV